jgi:PAS domain S-box-containing protein
MTRIKYITIIILGAVLLYFGINEYLSLIQVSKVNTGNLIKYQVKLCGKSIEDDYSAFEENLRYTFSTYNFGPLLTLDNEVPLEIRLNEVQTTITAIRRFYSKNQELISRLEVYNTERSRSFERDYNNYFKVSEVTTGQNNKLENQVKIIHEKDNYYIIHPVRDAVGIVRQNIKIVLDFDTFLRNHFDKYYIGKESYYWFIDNLGILQEIKYSEGAIEESSVKISKIEEINFKVLQELEGSQEHIIESPNPIKLLSGFYPVNLSSITFGIVFSINSDFAFESENAKALNIIVIGLLGMTSISFLFLYMLRKQKESNNIIQEREEQFRGIIENINDVFWEWTPDANFKYLSPQIFKIFGFHPEELIGKPVYTNIKKSNRYRYDLLFKAQMKRKTSFNDVEFTFYHKNGEEKVVEISGFPVFDSSNNLMYYRGVTRDITQTKIIMDKVNLTLSQMNAILNSMPFLAWLKDTFGRYITVNKSFGEFFKSEKEYFINKKDIDIYEFSIAEKFINADLEVLNTKKQVYFEYEIIRDNELLWYEAYMTPILDDKNNIIGLTGLARDISERKKFENEIIKSRDLADAANKAKSEFLANMSHEIRTPMNAILGFSEILLNTVKTPQEKNYLMTILNSGRILLALINDILDLSKIEAGRFDLELEPIDIRSIIDEIKYIFTQKSEEKGLTLIFEQSTSLPSSIMIDEIRMRQVILNLVGNAIKFTDNGFIKINTKVNYIYPNPNEVDLIIDIIDSGIGIPLDQQKLIFDAFRQQDGQSTRTYGGTGLGLAISRRLVEMMGGEITVKSEQGKGSTFTICLKRIIASNDIYAEKQEFDESINNYIFKDSTLLVVDDVFHNRELVKSFLANSTLKIFEAENGLQALEIASRVNPDLILMDLRMPVLNGYEANLQIKSNPAIKGIPIIAFTASFLKSDKENIENSFEGFISKPVSKATLFQTLVQYLKYDIINPMRSLLDVDIPLEITEISLEVYNLMIDKLENELIIKRNEILEVLWIDEAEKFSKQLNDLGSTYNINLLVNYSELLAQNISLFEIDKVEVQLREFESIIAEFKEIYYPKE